MVAVTVNIAFRPRSGDLILMNAGLAKPIPLYLVYCGRSSNACCGAGLLKQQSRATIGRNRQIQASIFVAMHNQI
jgi:hypothetical protein